MNGSFESINRELALKLGWCATSPGYDCSEGLGAGMTPWQVRPAFIDVHNVTEIGCTDGLLCLDLNSNDQNPPGGVTYPLSLTAGRAYVLIVDVGGGLEPCLPCGTVYYDSRNVTVALYTVTAGTVDMSPYDSHLISVPTPADGALCRTWQTDQNVVFVAQADSIVLSLSSTLRSTNCGPIIDNVCLYWQACLDGTQPPLENQQLWDVTCGDGWIVTPVGPPAPLNVSGPIAVNVRLSSHHSDRLTCHRVASISLRLR